MNFPLARQLNWSTLWPHSRRIKEGRNLEVRESRTAPFSSRLSLNQLSCTLCAWLHEQRKPGQPRYSWKGRGLLQLHSAATSFLLVPTIIAHHMSQIWKLKCKKKSAILAEWYGPSYDAYCWHKRQECDSPNLDEKCAADPSTPKHQGDLWAPIGNINASPFARAGGIMP